MSDVLTKAITALSAKMDGEDFDGSAKFVITDEGAIIIDGSGVHAGDEDTDVTLTATADVFVAILEGDQNPTSAFMSGQLSVDGDMGTAMKLAGIIG